jgi:hypothetical protein
MAGSSNFLQWNPDKNNQQTDGQYIADAMRSNGAESGVCPSVMDNKFRYQVSIMVAALGQVLSNKGFTVSDADLTALITVLTNIAIYPGDASKKFEAADGATAKEVVNISQLSKIFGVGQTWQNKTSSRVSGTTYTNSGYQPIMISVKSIPTGFPSNPGISGYVDDVLLFQTSGYGAGTSTCILMVPAGSTYKVIGGQALDTWYEFC